MKTYYMTYLTFVVFYKWKARTSVTDSVFLLEKPLLARYVRLTSPKASGSKAYNYTVMVAIPSGTGT